MIGVQFTQKLWQILLVWEKTVILISLEEVLKVLNWGVLVWVALLVISRHKLWKNINKIIWVNYAIIIYDLNLNLHKRNTFLICESHLVRNNKQYLRLIPTYLRQFLLERFPLNLCEPLNIIWCNITSWYNLFTYFNIKVLCTFKKFLYLSFCDWCFWMRSKRYYRNFIRSLNSTWPKSFIVCYLLIFPYMSVSRRNNCNIFDFFAFYFNFLNWFINSLILIFEPCFYLRQLFIKVNFIYHHCLPLSLI